MKKGSLRQKVVVVITMIMMFIWLFCASCMDSSSLVIPVIGLCISSIWLGLVFYANREKFEREER